MAPRDRKNRQHQNTQGSIKSSHQGMPKTDGSPPDLTSDPTHSSQYCSDSDGDNGDANSGGITTGPCRIYAVDVRKRPTAKTDGQTQPTNPPLSVSGRDGDSRRHHGDNPTHRRYSDQSGFPGSNASETKSISRAAPGQQWNHGSPLSSHVAYHPHPFTPFPSDIQSPAGSQFQGASAESEVAVDSYAAGFRAAERLWSSRAASAFTEGYSRGVLEESRRAALEGSHRSYHSGGSNRESKFSWRHNSNISADGNQQTSIMVIMVIITVTELRTLCRVSMTQICSVSSLIRLSYMIYSFCPAYLAFVLCIGHLCGLPGFADNTCRRTW